MSWLDRHNVAPPHASSKSQENELSGAANRSLELRRESENLLNQTRRRGCDRFWLPEMRQQQGAAQAGEEQGSSSAHFPEFVGINCSGALVDLDSQREEQCDDSRLDDYVREHERLNDGIDRTGAHGNIREHGRDAASAIADGQQQHICGRLQYSKAEDQMDEVPAGNNAVQTDNE